MKVVLVDDEPDAIYTLELIIQQFLPELQIIGKFTTAESAIKEIPILNPDILFIDINIPRMNGFEILQNIENQNFHIVFTTAYNEYATKGYKYNALDYLLKPIDIEELQNTVKRIKLKNKEQKSNKFDFTRILEAFNKQKDDKITISTTDGIYFLKPSEIIYLLASGSYTKIVRNDGDIIIVSKLLKEFEEIFVNDFFRVHHSYIINLQFVKMLNKVDGWRLVMDNGDIIPIARRKRNEIDSLISRISGKNFNTSIA